MVWAYSAASILAIGGALYMTEPHAMLMATISITLAILAVAMKDK